MMKKLLSIILTVCMLLSLVVVPVAVQAEESADTYAATTLGSYYKFTFGVDDMYNYAKDAKVEYKGAQFTPLYYQNATGASVGYKEVTDSVTGDKYDTLQLQSGSAIMFTPLTKDGQPFELKPGVEYTYKVNMFIPVGHCWVHSFVATGYMNPAEHRWSKYINIGTEEAPKYISTNYPYSNNQSLTNQGGSGWAYAIKDGTYGKSSTFSTIEGSTGVCLHKEDERFGLTCTHGPRTGTKPYVEKTNTFTLPAANFTLGEDNLYTATNEVYNDNAGTAISGNPTATYNNFFTLYLGGGSASQYAKSDYALYGNYTYDEMYNEEGTNIPIYDTYQIESIEIYEVGVGTVNFHNGDQVTTVKGTAGEAVALDIPAAPAGKYFVNWYTDADYTTPLKAVPTFTEGAPLELYAKFNEYGSNVRFDFDSKSHPTTAVQYTSAGGFYYPLQGYSIKGSYNSSSNNGEVAAHLVREGLSSTYPDGVVVFYSDRTWGQPGAVMAINPDGSLFVPEPGEQYKVTYRYRAPLHNGNNMGINVAYGISHTFANTSSTTDKTPVVSTLAYNTIEEPVTEWTTVTQTVTIPATISGAPGLGLNIGGVGKKAVYEEDGTTVKYYDYTMVELDYFEIEKIPTAKVNYLKADGSLYGLDTVVVGAEIPYPTLTASLNMDRVWSLAQDKYVPVPKTLEKEEDLTVYMFDNPVISYENYPVSTDTNVKVHGGAIAYDDEMHAVVSDKDAYTGSKSMRLRNYGMHWVVTEAQYTTAQTNGAYKYDAETDTFVKLDTVPEFVAANAETIANGTAFAYKRVSAETGMNIIREFTSANVTFSYKITFKYKATEKNIASSTLSARILPKANLWWGTKTITGSFTIPAGATDGWQTGEMYVAANDVYAGSVTGQTQVLDLLWTADATLNTNEIYIDDITIEENFVNTPKLYIHIGDEVTTVTEGLTAGGAFTVPTLEAPAGKYIIGWVDATGTELTTFKMPDATLLCEYHIYAKFGTYPDNVTIDTTGATQPTLKGYSAFTSSTLNETGWASRTYTAEGVKLEKALGGANKFDPAKATSGTHVQTSSLNDYVALANDLPVGEQTNGGWGAATQYILRDKDGNAIMAKPNTAYAITVSYEKIGQGTQALRVAIGKSAANVTTGETSGTSTFMKNASTYGIATDLDAEVTGENNTYTYYVTTGTFAEGDVPVIGLQYSASSFIVERVADANGVESYVYNADGKTYYPYKIVSRPGVLIKSVNIIEIDSGNVAVTYKTYEKGVGYTAVVKDNVPGAALDVATNNYDSNWYNNSTRITGGDVVTNYPSYNATYYNATYGQLYPLAGTFVTGDGKKNGGTEKEWTFENTLYDGKYALHIGDAKKEILDGDLETYMTGVTLQQGHTYKVTFKYKATAAHSKFGFNFYACQADNFWSKGSDPLKGSIAIAAGEATDGWVTRDVYFTADFAGTVTDETETGRDYTVNREYRRTLMMTFYQDANEAGNDLYFADIDVIDLGGDVIAEGGASILTDAAAEAAGNRQAMRYYFSYKTTDGSNIFVGDDELKVVERGFYYRNGYVANGDTVATMYTAAVKQSKAEDFNICWAYDEATGMMTFSTYVTGFQIGDTTKKLEVKAYIIVEDANGAQYTIYADSINRTVAGVGAGTDSDINAGL